MTRRDLELLQAQQEYPSVSITVGLAKTMPDRKNNVTKVRDSIKAAQERLLKECSESEAKPLIERLQTAFEDIDFERTSAQGLAIFVNKKVSQIYLLPVAITDRVIVDKAFEVRDILQAISRMPRYWVLELSEKPSRLFYGVFDELIEIIEPAQDEFGVDKDGFPYSYVATEDERIRQTQRKDLAQDASYFDGHKEKFFERVFKLAERFIKVESLPLVIISTEKNHSLFEKASHNYPIAVWVHGDYCKRNAHDIAQVVWPEVKKYIDQQVEKKIANFEEKAVGTRKHAFGFQNVWRDAQEGRVHELLVEEGFAVGGAVDPKNPTHLTLDKNAGNDLVNDLIELVLSKGDATVTFCKPGSLKKYEQVAAVLRY